MKIKAIMTIPSFGLEKNAIYDAGLSEEYKKALCREGVAIEIQADEVDESLVDDYTSKPYPNKMLVIKDNAMYRSNVGEGNFTSATWVIGEWTLKLQGA